MKRKKFFAIVMMCLSVFTLYCKEKSDNEHWDYRNASHWGENGKGACACKAGKNQSPIDLEEFTKANTLYHRVINVNAPIIKLMFNGHSVQGNVTPTTTFLHGTENFELLQFHFHTPAEHAVKGVGFPMEMHLVHKAANGGLAVLSVLFVSGAANPWLANVLNYLSEEKRGTRHTLGLNLTKIATDTRHLYAYDGSLTTPPCSEGVRWFILRDPVFASEFQIAALHSLEGDNARPVQKANDRKVRAD